MSSTSSALNNTSRPNSSPVSSSGAQTSSTDSGSGESMRRRFAGGATSPKSEPSSQLSIVSARSSGGGGASLVPSAKRTDFFGATGAGSVFSLAGVAGSETIKSEQSANRVCEQLFSLRRDGREYCSRFGGDDGGEMVRGVIVTTQFGLVVRAVVVWGDSGSSAAPLSSGIVTTRGRSPTLSVAIIEL